MPGANAVEAVELDDLRTADASPFERMERLLSTAPVLRGLDRNMLADLACCSIERPHDHGRVLLSETTGSDPDEREGSVLLLTAGWCLAVRSHPNGARAVVAVCRPGEIAGIERLTTRRPAGTPAWVASGEGASIRLPVAAVRDAMRGSTGAGADLENALAGRVAWVEGLVAERLLPPTERLLGTLRRLAWTGAASKAGVVEIPLTQGELAAVIGSTRETVNRSLRRLAREGAVALRDGRALVLRS